MAITSCDKTLQVSREDVPAAIGLWSNHRGRAGLYYSCTDLPLTALSIVSSKSTSFSGLRRYADAPAEKQRSCVCGSSCPVMTIAGTENLEDRSCWSTCNPERPGMCRSRITQSGCLSTIESRKVWPE